MIWSQSRSEHLCGIQWDWNKLPQTLLFLPTNFISWNSICYMFCIDCSGVGNKAISTFIMSTVFYFFVFLFFHLYSLGLSLPFFLTIMHQKIWKIRFLNKKDPNQRIFAQKMFNDLVSKQSRATQWDLVRFRPRSFPF